MSQIQAQALYTHFRSRGAFAAPTIELILACARLGVVPERRKEVAR